MSIWPLKFRVLDDGRLFFANDAGGFFVSDDAFVSRYATDALTERDHAFLRDEGHSFERAGDLPHTAFAHRWAARQSVQPCLSYLILVPTLRCDLACTYCQVSRASETARGYDWTDDLVKELLLFVDRLHADEIKIEFQGGEPTLRMDLLNEVRDFCRKRFQRSEFVVCTNLQNLGSEQLAFFESPDTFVSTSVDGSLADHDRHRTQDATRAAMFFSNLHTLIGLCGSSRLSALPTIDVRRPPDIPALIDTYESLGLRSIYLRPMNYQGFARRTALQGDELQNWNRFHADFMHRLIERNFATGTVMEEYYFSHCLRRVLRPGHDGHVDLRNPSLFGADYLVINYDGRLYPTDEARMLSRIGHIDLSIGSVGAGIDRLKVEPINGSGANNFDPDCIHCAYQPFCGSDPVDDVSRYGRVDVPRPGTWFCGRQLSVFDRAVALIYTEDEKELYSLRHWAGVASWPAELAPSHS